MYLRRYIKVLIKFKEYKSRGASIYKGQNISIVSQAANQTIKTNWSAPQVAVPVHRSAISCPSHNKRPR